MPVKTVLILSLLDSCAILIACLCILVALYESVDALLNKIRDKADEHAGFGWAQSPSYDKSIIGGEFRGNKKTAQLMSAGLAVIPGMFVNNLFLAPPPGTLGSFGPI